MNEMRQEGRKENTEREEVWKELEEKKSCKKNKQKKPLRDLLLTATVRR